jgi:hypothetical protein
VPVYSLKEVAFGVLLLGTHDGDLGWRSGH